MPEVEDQRCAVGLACWRTSDQVSCLKVRDSGPCSWIMVASFTAEDREVWTVSRPVESKVEMDNGGMSEGKYSGRTDEMCSCRSGRGSYTDTGAELYVRWRARKDIPMAPRPIRVMCSSE